MAFEGGVRVVLRGERTDWTEYAWDGEDLDWPSSWGRGLSRLRTRGLVVLTGESVKIFVIWPLSVGGQDGLLFRERGDIGATGVGCGGSGLVALPVRKRRTPFMTVLEENHHQLHLAVVVADVGHVLHLPMATVLGPISRERDPDARLCSQQGKQAAGHRRQDRSR